MDVPKFQAPSSHVETFHRGARAYERGIAAFTRGTAEQLLAEVPLGCNAVVIDLGTGPGPVVSASQSRGARSIGVDLGTACFCRRARPSRMRAGSALPALRCILPPFG